MHSSYLIWVLPPSCLKVTCCGIKLNLLPFLVTPRPMLRQWFWCPLVRKTFGLALWNIWAGWLLVLSCSLNWSPSDSGGWCLLSTHSAIFPGGFGGRCCQHMLLLCSLVIPGHQSSLSSLVHQLCHYWWYCGGLGPMIWLSSGWGVCQGCGALHHRNGLSMLGRGLGTAWR